MADNEDMILFDKHKGLKWLTVFADMILADKGTLNMADNHWEMADKFFLFCSRILEPITLKTIFSMKFWYIKFFMYTFFIK